MPAESSRVIRLRAAERAQDSGRQRGLTGSRRSKAPQPRDSGSDCPRPEGFAVGRAEDAVRTIEHRPAAAEPLAFGADFCRLGTMSLT